MEQTLDSAVHLFTKRQNIILDVAARIFAERGFSGTDVQLIADAAEVGKGTVYRNFGTKEELFLAAVDSEMRVLTEVLLEASEHESDPLDSLRAVVRSYLAHIESNPRAVELLIVERAVFKDRAESTYIRYKESLRGYWEELMSRLVENGTFRALPPQRIFDLISDTLYGVIFTNHFANRHDSCEEQAEAILDMFMNGFMRERST